MSALALGSSVTEGHAGAQQRAEINLDWHAPFECPDQRAISARVSELVGDRAAANATTLEVHGLVTLLPDGRFRLELDTIQGGIERTRMLEAPTCAGLAEAGAVVIALAVSPALEPRMPSAPPPSPSAFGAPSSTKRALPAADIVTEPHAPARPEHRVWGFDAGAGIAVDFGAMASTALGGSLLGALRYRERASFGLRASFFPTRDSTVLGKPSEGARLFLAAFAPLACLAPVELPVELAACAEFEFGYLHAAGFGTPLNDDRLTSWLAPGAGLSAVFPKNGRWRSRLTADALLPLSRTKFVLTNVGVAHELPSVEPRLGLYVELALP